MTLMKHENAAITTRGREFFDRFFDDRWPIPRRPFLLWPDDGEGVRLEEYKEDSTLVVRAELAGIDPVKDVTISASDGMLRIEAKKQSDEETKERDYVRREFRYGSFVRDVALPHGVTDKDIAATYTDGILEVKVHLPSGAETPRTIPVKAK